MQKIRLGKSNLMVTPLGFGGIPIQRLNEADAVKVVARCLDLGLNYIDTANAYTTSEERVGKAIKGRKRSEIIIATKTGSRVPDDMKKNIDLSLQRLGTDYIDLYQFHQIGDMPTLKKILDPSSGMMKVMEDAKKAGKIRHIGASSHQMDVAKEIVKSDAFETLMFPFNFITSEPAVELLPLCRQHDVGFIVMKPLAGGMLDNATLCFKYLLQFPDILTIPGIEKPGEIEEIVKIYEGPHKLTAAEKKQMAGLKAELGTRFCRRCDYCRPCQQGIPISMVMSFPSFAKRMPPSAFSAGCSRTPWPKYPAASSAANASPNAPSTSPSAKCSRKTSKPTRSGRRL